MAHTEDEWTGCYGGGWGTILSQESYAHPAKVSKNLAERIYSHVIAEGWAKQGSRVIDPFGGIGGFAYYAMLHGMHWVGCELESRFVMLGQGVECDGHTCPECSAEIPETEQSSMFATPERAPHRYHGNIERWEQKGFKGTARLLNGDSRRLVAVIREANLGVTSPPYILCRQNSTRLPPVLGQYSDEEETRLHDLSNHKYGEADGQLGTMKEGDHALAISSPSFGSSTHTEHRAENMTAGKARRGGDEAMRIKQDYAPLEAEGNLAHLEATEDGLSVAISSPPYAGVSDKHDRTGAERARRQHERLGFKQGIGCFKASEAYGDSEGQLGGMDEGDFDASLAISSPPYAEGVVKMRSSERDTERLESRGMDTQRFGRTQGALHGEKYGQTEGQLGNLPSSEESLNLAVSSPPYINSVNAGDHGIDWSKVDRSNPNTGNRKRGENTPHGKRLRDQLSYTENPDPANLGAMGPGDFESALYQMGEWVKMCECGWVSQRFIKLPNPHDDNCPSCESTGSCVWGRIPVGTSDVAISSPPYNLPMSQDHSGKRGGKRGHTPSEQGAFARYGNTEGQLEGMKSDQESFDTAIGSPPYPQPHSSGGGLNVEGYSKDWQKNDRRDLVGKRTYRGRGADREEGNLETMETGDYETAISSPPFMASEQSRDQDFTFNSTKVNPSARPLKNRSYNPAEMNTEGQLTNMKGQDFDTAISSPPYISGGHHNDVMGAWNANGRGHGVAKDEAGYGRENGQVGQMKEGDIDASITSPPYEASHVTEERNFTGGGGNETPARGINREGYGVDEAQITKEAETFWSASRLILEQLYEILVPGAAAVFVVKRFVRRGSIVDFPAQWARLCEAVGFVWLHDHHALLTEEHGEQHTLEGGIETKKTQFKSFFRRLHERKSPETAIEWESVLCFVKPRE